MRYLTTNTTETQSAILRFRTGDTVTITSDTYSFPQRTRIGQTGKVLWSRHHVYRGVEWAVEFVDGEAYCFFPECLRMAEGGAKCETQ